MRAVEMNWRIGWMGRERKEGETGARVRERVT